MLKSLRSRPNSTRGLTLIEILITLSIVALIAVLVGSSGLSDLILDTRMSTSTNSLVANIQLARSEAVERNTQVGLCASNDGLTCSGEPDDGWKAGAIVFTDPNRNCGFDGDPEIILRISDPMSDKQEITAANHTLCFSPDGSVDGNSTVSEGGGDEGGGGTIGG